MLMRKPQILSSDTVVPSLEGSIIKFALDGKVTYSTLHTFLQIFSKRPLHFHCTEDVIT